MFFDVGSWIIAFLCVNDTVFYTWKFCSLRRSDPGSRLHGRSFLVVMGVSVMWAIGIYIIGLRNILEDSD